MISSTTVNGSVDPNILYPSVYLAQDKWLLPFLGTDLLNKIKARQAEMDLADAKEISALKRAEKAAKEKEQEMNELAMIIGGCAFVLFLVFVGVNELMEFCATTRRCGR